MKKNVSKSGTKLKWFCGGRTTRQRTTTYKHEVKLENDMVVGWKDLESLTPYDSQANYIITYC